MAKRLVKGESKDKRKALLFQRFIAFIIDMILVSLVVSIISTPFVDTKKLQNIESEVVELSQKAVSEEITMKEYYSQYQVLYYKIGRNSGIQSILTIFCSVLYFVVYQVYAKGQTFGKKIMKIRVISTEGDLFYDQLIFRSMLSNFILVDIIGFVFMLIGNKAVYLSTSMIFNFLQYFYVIICVFMIMNRKNGDAIHDKIAHTMVIRED